MIASFVRPLVGRTLVIPGGVSGGHVTGFEAELQRFDDRALLASGKVNIIALDAVAQRFGERWPLRRSQVYDHVARTLQRLLGAHGYYARVSETDFLIAQPDLNRYSAQASCLRFLREILGHFLGEAHLADDGVHEVTRISQKGIEAARVDARKAEEGEQLEIEEQRRRRQGWRESVDQWSPFVAADGRKLHVTCVLEPVYELKGYSRIGFRLVRQVLQIDSGEILSPAEIINLARVDIIRIDMATIMRGLDRLNAEHNMPRPPSVIIPVSCTSLAAQRGRSEIIGAFRNARGLVNRGVICELVDIEGVPLGALQSMVATVRPFSLLTVGCFAREAWPQISSVKGAGLQGLAFERPSSHDEEDCLAWATRTIDTAKRVVRSVLIYGAASAGEAAMAGLLGATHASVRAL